MADDREFSVGEMSAAAKEARAAMVSRAWKRLLLDDDGKVRPDGRIVLKDMFLVSGFFDRGYELGNPDKTLELAVKRAFVNHILAALRLDPEQLSDLDVARAVEIRNDTRLETEMRR